MSTLDGDKVLEQLRVQATTNPVPLALRAGVPTSGGARHIRLASGPRRHRERRAAWGECAAPLQTALTGRKHLYSQQMDSSDPGRI
ncbi:hypothetical protein OG937_45365 [Streptomyces sp. NBC_00510]